MLLLQRNELLTEKQKFMKKKFGRFLFTNFLINLNQSEYLEENTINLFKLEIETIKNFIPKSVNNIMDIGCGLGILDVLLNDFYINKPSFYLLDKNRTDRKIKYGFSTNYESYNDLNETKQILLDNNIDKNQIFLFDVDKEILIERKMDLVISLKSMGYHYPLEIYIDLLRKCCNQDTIFIFDLSSGYYSEKLLVKYFLSNEIIYQEESVHSLKRVLCKGLKN